MNFLRRPVVEARIGKTRSELHDDIANKKFPAPVNIGPRAVAWVEDEVTEWQKARIAERDEGRALEPTQQNLPDRALAPPRPRGRPPRKSPDNQAPATE